VVAVSGVDPQQRFDGNYSSSAPHVLRIEPKLPDFGYVCYLTVRRSGSND